MKKATKKKMTIEDLAIITQNSLSGMEGRINNRLENIEGNIKNVEERLKEVEFGQRKNNQDILNLGEKYVTQSKFNNWTMRVMNLENKKSKSK